MSEPRTKAGQRFESENGTGHRNLILAIEAEAAAIDPERLARALTSLRQPLSATVVGAIMSEGYITASSWHSADRKKAEAIIAAYEREP